MGRFFNMIPGKETACILLYGEIGEYDRVNSGDIARELIEAESGGRKIDVRINSVGGDVFTGLAIFNAFRQSAADITIYIDGVAASMGSVIAACGKPVKMSRYARLMIHAPSGVSYGNVHEMASVMSMLQGLEETLCDIYAGRCGKDRETIRAEWFDGTDHWFTADEALALGLIDEIYDADPVPADSTPEQIYRIFNNRLNKPQNHTDMNLEELRKRPSFKNCATDEDALRHIDHLEQEAGKVSSLTEERDRLKTENEEYARKEAEAREAEMEQMLDDAEEDGRLTSAMRATYKALLKADRVNGEAALKALKPKKLVANSLQTPPQGGGGSAWDARMEEIRNRNKNK